ncbi:MAG: endopeptidase La [Lachnospiraceae bacterium]|nr:endopeptidase La [Lachnospiraceae bacterium]
MAVLPVYNTLVVPEGNTFIQTDYYKKTTGRNPVPDERIILLVLKENTHRDKWTPESFYPIGLVGQISEIHEEGYLLVHGNYRANIEEVTIYPGGQLDVSISHRPDTGERDSEDEARRLKEIKRAVVKFSEGFQWGQAIRGLVARWSSISEAAAALSPWMMNTNEERYAVLAEDSVLQRDTAMEQMIYENLEMSRIKGEAQSAQEEDHQKIYRETAIKKQIEYLQQELDDMHPENVSDVRRFEVKIQESGMNETARKEADKVLNRLKQEGKNSAEYGMLYDYLDFLTTLFWKKEEASYIDLGQAEKVLDEDHFGLGKVKDRIIQQIAVMNLKHQQSGSILCFVGAPGTGKTSIGQSIARALRREYVRVSLGGVRDEADIRGHRRTYIGAMPGRLMDGIHKSGVSNPVVVLDEVDKLSQSYNGDPASALLEVLDPEQNHTFTDHYMNVPYDLSGVLFICTANTLDTIPEPLLNRMEVIRFQGYTPREKYEIAVRHLLPKAREAVGLQEGSLEISEDALKTVISDYTRESGVRGLKKRMDTLCRKAAVEIVKAQAAGEEAPVVHVEKDNIRDYLEDHPIRHGRVKDTARPGVVTGLAWTSVGGEILYIETLLTEGKGNVTVTGQLGDVMKESAQLAVSLVKSLFPKEAAQLKDHDLHIHVPDGSTPKDGPSAGITLTTALSSLLTGVPVTPRVAMTGEISLQGTVEPIGGLPEKLMAAERAGVEKVFIPADNEDDLRDVPAEVKDRLTICPVHRAEEVLQALNILSKA